MEVVKKWNLIVVCTVVIVFSGKSQNNYYLWNGGVFVEKALTKSDCKKITYYLDSIRNETILFFSDTTTYNIEQPINYDLTITISYSTVIESWQKRNTKQIIRYLKRKFESTLIHTNISYVPEDKYKMILGLRLLSVIEN